MEAHEHIWAAAGCWCGAKRQMGLPLVFHNKPKLLEKLWPGRKRHEHGCGLCGAIITCYGECSAYANTVNDGKTHVCPKCQGDD